MIRGSLRPRLLGRVWGVRSSSAAAVEVAREYLTDFRSYWSGPWVRQADKLERKITGLCKREHLQPGEVVDRMIELAVTRRVEAPPPVYVTGLGGSGSHWLAGMLHDLGLFTAAGEVYFPPPLREQLTSLAQPDRAFVIDAVHLVHAWTNRRDLGRHSIVNNAAGAYEIPLYRSWDPGCITVYLVRDPRDQVLSATFRKAEYRAAVAPGESDDEYLQRNIERNRADYKRYRAIPKPADVECRYEDLRRDPVPWLRRIVDAGPWQVSDADLRAAAEQHDADRIRAGLTPPRGNLDAGGRAGSWRDDAPPEIVALLDDRLREVIVGLGYDLD